MTTEIAPVRDERKELALLKAIGLDRVTPEQRELAIKVAERYQLDLLLKHAVVIEGRLYITRDGLLHIAHRSGQLDGIETTEPVIVDDFWRATCSVYRKDMTHAFTYTGRYPTRGGNQKYAPEMSTKVAEVMALRRAFDVSAPSYEERWDLEAPEATEPPAPKPTLAEVVATKAAAVTPADEDRSAHHSPSSVEITDERSMPPRLGRETFRSWAEGAGIPRERVVELAKAMFPGTTGDLDDYQRAKLKIALEAEEAPTEELGLVE